MEQNQLGCAGVLCLLSFSFKCLLWSSLNYYTTSSVVSNKVLLVVLTKVSDNVVCDTKISN